MGLRDYDRPLNKRGEINAEFMADKFKSENVRPLIVTSGALRALTTAQYFAKALGYALEELVITDEIYGADVREMMKLITSLPDSYDSVILFGHNPTFSELANHLDISFQDHMVTCSRVCMQIEVDKWAHVSSNSGSVLYHYYPRMYSEMENL